MEFYKNYLLKSVNFLFQQDTVVPRWTVISEALSKEIKCVEDLERAILEYNSRYASKWKFRGLHALLEQVHCCC